MSNIVTEIAIKYYQVHTTSYVCEARDKIGFSYIERTVTCKVIVKIKPNNKNTD